MKRAIATLVNSWVCDNREYIENNFIDIEDYLLSWMGNDNWAYDFFNNEEIENNTEEQLEYYRNWLDEVIKQFIVIIKGEMKYGINMWS